jgi:FkbM family methyltransferase
MFDTEVVQFDDKLKMKIFKDDLYIGKSVKAGYGWDRWMIPILEQIDHTGKVIVDVGANIGACALMFSYYAPVYAYEPFHIDVLSENCKQDTNYKVTPIGKALSDKVETRKFYYNHENCGTGSFHDSYMNANGEFESTTIDLEDIKEPISFIKIDVQGDDLNVLKGGINTLTKNKPVVAIECVEDHEVKNAVEFMQTMGYKRFLKCPEWMYVFYFE